MNIDGIGELKFSFEHKPTTTLAYCELDGVMYAGGAQLSKHDQYCKATGRRVALHNVLKHGLIKLEQCEATLEMPSITHRWVKVVDLTREMRRTIWAAYFAAHADLRKGKK